MNTPAPQTIALIEWNWMGHHPSYGVQLALALGEAGLDVVPFCADPQDFEGRLQQQHPPPRPSLNGKPAGRIHGAEQIYWAPARLTGPRRLRAIDQAIHHFGFLGKLLRRWSARRGISIDQVFFACIYDQEFEYFAYAEPFFRFGWSGLYFNSRFFRLPGTLIPYSDRPPSPQKIFRLRSCRGVAIVDPQAQAPLQAILGPDKPVVLIPDFTDTSLPDPTQPQPASLARKLRAFAQGRPIVSLVGHLQRTKGLVAFTEAATAHELRDIFFFLGGAINWHQIDGPTRTWLLQQWETSSNIYAHLQHISSESSLNQVLQISDVVFAAYTDFPNSSNIMTKAAFLRRPVLVSQGHLMGELVHRYRLGECVPAGDGAALRATLRRMVAADYVQQLAARARWSAYCRLHHRDRLPGALAQLLARDQAGEAGR
jgi:hypothetical protein